MSDEIKTPSNVSIEKERQDKLLAELSANVGLQAKWQPRVWGKDKVTVNVLITGASLAFGGTYTIQPLSGEGTTKVRKDGLEIIPKEMSGD